MDEKAVEAKGEIAGSTEEALDSAAIEPGDQAVTDVQAIADDAAADAADAADETESPSEPAEPAEPAEENAPAEDAEEDAEERAGEGAETAGDAETAEAADDAADPVADMAASADGSAEADRAGEPASSDDSASEESSAPQNSAKGVELIGTGHLVAVGIISIILGVLLCLPTFLGGSGASGAAGAHDTSGGVAATVNGVDIGENEITEYVATFRSTQGFEKDEDWGAWLSEYGYTPQTLRQSTVDYFVQIELLNQAIAENGIEVPDSKVDEQIASIASQLGGEEALESALKADGLSLEEYRTALLQELKRQELAKQVVTDVAAVDDAQVLEVLKLYYPDSVDEAATTLDGVDEQVVQSVRDMLESSSREQGFSQWLQQYQAGADIKVNDMPAGLPYDVDMPAREASVGNGDGQMADDEDAEVIEIDAEDLEDGDVEVAAEDEGKKEAK